MQKTKIEFLGVRFLDRMKIEYTFRLDKAKNAIKSRPGNKYKLHVHITSLFLGKLPESNYDLTVQILPFITCEIGIRIKYDSKIDDKYVLKESMIIGDEKIYHPDILKVAGYMEEIDFEVIP